MAWSTRELAELADTTLNTVRYYHRRGLLDEPPRSPNGYKRYGADHLIRLLQIRRLRDLGVPVAEISRTGTGVGTSPEVLAALDAELAETIDRAQRARAELAELMEDGGRTDLPAGFASVSRNLSAAERALALVSGQVYAPTAMADVRRMLAAETDDGAHEFEALPEDADETTRARLSSQLAETLATVRSAYPWLAEPVAELQRPPRAAAAAMIETMRAIYNPAQLDVLGRAAALALDRAADGASPP